MDVVHSETVWDGDGGVAQLAEVPTRTGTSGTNCPVLPPEQYGLLDRVNERIQQLSVRDIGTPRVQLLAMGARAVHAYQERSYDACLTLLWTVVENLITKRYEADKEQAATAQSLREAERAHVNISRCINALQERGRMPAPRKECIDEVRVARNKFVHDAEKCDDVRCDKAYDVLADLVREDWKITLPLLQSRPII